MFDLVKSTRKTRDDLLEGPTVTINVPIPIASLTYSIPNIPRRMLFALSHTVSLQLQDPTKKSITLPEGATTPAAVEYLITWTRHACLKTLYKPITPLPHWRQTVMVYNAARLLGVQAAETDLGRWIGEKIDEGALSFDQFRTLLEKLPPDHALVRKLMAKTAHWRRTGQLQEQSAIEAYLLEQRPDLFTQWTELDNKFKVHEYIFRKKQALREQRKEKHAEEKKSEGEEALETHREIPGLNQFLHC